MLELGKVGPKFSSYNHTFQCTSIATFSKPGSVVIFGFSECSKKITDSPFNQLKFHKKTKNWGTVCTLILMVRSPKKLHELFN